MGDKPRVGIFEIDHDEMGYSLIKSFRRMNYDVWAFVSESVYRNLMVSQDLQDVQINWIVKKEIEGMSDFYKRIVSLSNSNKISTLFLNTVEASFDELAIHLNAYNGKSILTIHNVNYWFNFSPFFFTKSYRLNKSKIRLKHKVDAFCVLSDNVKKYLIEKFHPNKPIHVFPYCVYEKGKYLPDLSSQTLLTICVPGSVDGSRRDYAFLLDIYEALLNSKQIIHLILLGRPVGKYGDSIISRCRSINSNGGTVTFFEGHVNQLIFEKYMMQSHFILSPLAKSIRGESYGVSKETGCFFDMARYSKPGIVPNWIPIQEYLKTSVLTYETSEQLKRIIGNIYNQIDMREEYLKKAEKNSMSYSIEIIAQRTHEFVSCLIKK